MRPLIRKETNSSTASRGGAFSVKKQHNHGKKVIKNSALKRTDR